MSKKLFYPAIFEEEEVGYLVHFPDIPGCITEGDTMEEAFEMAKDALGLNISYMRDTKKDIPQPSKPTDIKTGKGQSVVIIELDYAEYLRKNEARAVKKTLSIPSWLNEEASIAGVNFSQVLQEALMLKLKVPQKQNKI